MMENQFASDDDGHQSTENSENHPTKVASRVKKEIDWSKYGLANKTSYQQSTPTKRAEDYLYTTESKVQVKDLFEDQQENSGDPESESWWKSSFFITTKLLFGTWDGVFTTCVMNMVGVVIFLRSGWMVGYAGIGLSLLIVLSSFLIALCTAMSAVGICDRCDVGKGGVYFIITHVLGGKIGGTIGLLYCFGHAIATSLYCTGFAESLVELINWKSAWAIRCVSIITLFVLLGIALSGVKWIVRFQLLLLAILAAAMLDYIIGTLALSKPDDGFTGFSNFNFESNLGNAFTSSTGFFVVFGVFFPAACGVLAGVNMSGDLKEPSTNIPEGSLASIAVCGGLYTIIVLFLGSTCTREALKSDYMIMEKVSLVGGLFIFGLFVAALSSSLGGLVGPPRVLQSIAEDDVLPILSPFSKVAGTNEEPRNATLITALIALGFIFVGNLNALAPIVTMPFLMTYSTINYAYFALAMSYDIKSEQKYGTNKDKSNKKKDMKQIKDNKDESLKSVGEGVKDKSVYEAIEDNTDSPTADDNDSNLADGLSETNSTSELFKKDYEMKEIAADETSYHTTVVPMDYQNKRERTISRTNSYQGIQWIQEKHPNELYARLCNRWVSLITCFVCFLLSFCISWVYALANLSVTLLLYIFISQARPGLSPGISSDFNVCQWLYAIVSRSKASSRNPQERVIVQNCVPYGISMYQISQDNVDYEHRDKKHHASHFNRSFHRQSSSESFQ